jgi:hypothetical protein
MTAGRPDGLPGDGPAHLLKVKSMAHGDQIAAAHTDNVSRPQQALDLETTGCPGARYCPRQMSALFGWRRAEQT